MQRSTLFAGAMLLALAACDGSDLSASASEADKMKLAAEIAAVTTDSDMIGKMFDTMKVAAMPNLEAICGALDEPDRATCLGRAGQMQPAIQAAMDESMDTVKGMMPEIMKDMTAVMAEIYTGPELAKMRDFYVSPEGRAIVKKQPEVMAQFMPRIMARMQSMQGDMMRKMKDRMDEVMREQGFTPPADSPI